MGRILGILISSVIFYLIFRFFGLTPKAYTASECGFFYGLAHGYIAVPCLIVKLFTSKQVLFAGNNTGVGYWLGYIIGLFFLGGLGFLKGSRREDA